MSHTTLLMILSDGTHRTASWNHTVKFPEICESMADMTSFLHKDVKVCGACLVEGSEMRQYTAGEITEFLKNV